MQMLRIYSAALLAIGGVACTKHSTSSTVTAKHAFTTSGEANATEANSSPLEANPVRIIRQEGSFSYLGVDGDYLVDGMRFPEGVGAFERGSIVDYNSIALGHSIGYNDPAGITITVFLYGVGGNAEEELQQAVRDMASHPTAQANFEFLGSAPISIEIEGEHVNGYIGLAHYPKTATGSQAIVFSTGGRFLKFRVSAPLQTINERMDEIRDVLLSFGRPNAES